MHTCMYIAGSQKSLHLRGHLQANRHKRLRDLYGQRMMSQYRNVGLGELSPHTYAIAEQARFANLHKPA